MNWLKDFGPTEGPLGFPMTDKAAQALDAILKKQPAGPEFSYRHGLIAKAPTELNPGERSDVSWISTESPDRHNEVVIARGMNDAQFAANPLVTLAHNYGIPPVGRSAWRKRIKDGPLVGIKAKTVYPSRPESWPADECWVPDKVLALIQAGLLQGKSIGFLPLRVHAPDDKEQQLDGWQDVRLVIDEWLLLEYAVCFLPANQDALVESVSKGVLSLPSSILEALGLKALPPAPPKNFTSLREVERAVDLQLQKIDFEALTRQAVQDILDRERGRV